MLASGSIGPFIAFGLGAFPTDALTRLLRRLVDKQLDQKDEETADQVINLQGVTPDVSATLAGEGLSSASQLANIDPVALAIRSGLSFDYLVNLVAQSQAWCFMGAKTVAALGSLGLGDARSIAQLVERLEATTPNEEAVGVLAAASAATGLPVAVLTFEFRQIAQDRYTQFLLAISQDEEAEDDVPVRAAA